MKSGHFQNALARDARRAREPRTAQRLRLDPLRRFMNSIRFHGNPANNPDIYVILGVDGLSYHTVQSRDEKRRVLRL